MTDISWRLGEDGPALLTDLVEGLLALHLRTLADTSPAQRVVLAQRYADELAAGADRLTAPGNFTDRAERAQALNALAGAFAILAMHPGGVTWAGRHWCTAPHPACPTRREGK